MLADQLEARLKPKGPAVVLKAQHQCMVWRGVRETGTIMTTSIMRGAVRDSKAVRSDLWHRSRTRHGIPIDEDIRP